MYACMHVFMHVRMHVGMYIEPSEGLVSSPQVGRFRLHLHSPGTYGVWGYVPGLDPPYTVKAGYMVPGYSRN